jgi:steroid delta-isomerase
MPDPNEIRGVLERYAKLLTAGDHRALAALYADDATIEDPIGAPLQRGADAIAKFYEASAGKVTMKLTGPVRVAGREAAAPFRVLVGPEGQRSVIDVIDVMTFDDEGKITSMRAFWSPDAIRPATDDD